MMPQHVWSAAQREAVGKHLVKALAWTFFHTKQLTGRLPRALRPALMPPLRWAAGGGRREAQGVSGGACCLPSTHSVALVQG